MDLPRITARHKSDASNTARSAPEAGFSLTEVMIAVAIVGILAGIAIPGYAEHVRAARRTDATMSLVNLSARLERHYTETSSYATATIDTDDATDVLASADTAEGFYTLSIVTAETTATTFTIKATRKTDGAQASDTKCGDFTLTDLELRGVTGSDSVADCW